MRKIIFSAIMVFVLFVGVLIGFAVQPREVLATSEDTAVSQSPVLELSVNNAPSANGNCTRQQDCVNNGQCPVTGEPCNGCGQQNCPNNGTCPVTGEPCNGCGQQDCPNNGTCPVTGNPCNSCAKQNCPNKGLCDGTGYDHNYGGNHGVCDGSGQASGHRGGGHHGKHH